MYLSRVYKNISCVLHIMHYLLLCVLCTTDYWLLTVYKKNRTKPKKTQNEEHKMFYKLQPEYSETQAH